MPLEAAIMIEAQEGLTWERWERIARTAEDAGFDALFRSDHLTGIFGDATRPSLDCWASLTWLATANRLDLEDIAAMELIAREVLPALRRS